MSEKKHPNERVRDIAPIGFRLPAALKQRVANAAKSYGKSMNALVVDVLEDAFPPERPSERELLLIRATYRYNIETVAAGSSEDLQNYVLGVITRYLEQRHFGLGLDDALKKTEGMDLSSVTVDELSEWFTYMERVVLTPPEGCPGRC